MITVGVWVFVAFFVWLFSRDFTKKKSCFEYIFLNRDKKCEG